MATATATKGTRKKTRAKAERKVDPEKVAALTTEVEAAWGELQEFKRKSAATVFRLGKNLHELKKAVKHPNYKAYCDLHLLIPHATAYQAMRLYRVASKAGKGEDDLAEYSITAAKVTFGIVKAKREEKETRIPYSISKNAPLPVIRFARRVKAVREALAEAVKELDKLDKGDVARLAEELAELSRRVAGMSGHAAKTKSH